MSAFMLFAFVASITPGPTNILVLTNGSRYGLIPTLPLVCGAAAGATSLVWIAGAGLADPLNAHPAIRTVLMAVGLIWLTWLAIKLFLSAAPDLRGKELGSVDRRQGAATGAVLQLVNPKTWMMAFAVVGIFLPELGLAGYLGATKLAATFGAIAVICLIAWALAGSQSAHFLTTPSRIKRFNQTMAVLLLVASWSAVLL